jgi:YidB-like protein
MILSGHGSWEKSNEPRFLSLNLGGTSPGRLLIDGLGELMDRFKQSGDTAESWIGTGPNKSMTSAQLEQAIGPEMWDTSAKQTGLSKDNLLGRLSRLLPDAVDSYTPDHLASDIFARRCLSISVYFRRSDDLLLRCHDNVDRPGAQVRRDLVSLS